MIDLTWTATIGITVGHLTEGTQMVAHFATFYELRDGRIAVIRNYDCFDPF